MRPVILTTTVTLFAVAIETLILNEWMRRAEQRYWRKAQGR